MLALQVGGAARAMSYEMIMGIYSERYEAILVEIDHATEPAVMSKEDALEWLKELIGDLNSRVEALRDELREEDSLERAKNR